MRVDSCSESGESNRHNSTPVAFSEKSAKLTPAPSHVAPSGYGCPGQTFIVHPSTESTLNQKTGSRFRAFEQRDGQRRQSVGDLERAVARVELAPGENVSEATAERAE